MRSHPLPEARGYADLMLSELRKVIPSFLKRVDLDRPRAWPGAPTWPPTARPWRTWPVRCSPTAIPPTDGARRSSCSTSTPTARSSWSPPCSTPTRTCPRPVLEQRVRAMSLEERLAVVRAYVGDRANRRHKPGRALERIDYRFDVLADYGAFRDLQRHRMLTDRVAAAEPAPRLHPSGGRRPGRVRRAVRRGDGALGRPLRRAGRAVPGAGVLRRVPGLQGPVRTCR